MKTFVITLVVVLLAGFLLQAPFDRLNTGSSGDIAENLQANILVAKKEQADRIFSEISLEAKAIIVEEYPSGNVLFAKNKDAVYPLASIAKLMTALTLQDVEQYKTSPFPLVVPITTNAVLQEGDNGFLVGEKFYFDDLVDIMLVQSSNDAAYALAAVAGGLFYTGELDEEASVSAFLQLSGKVSAWRI